MKSIALIHTIDPLIPSTFLDRWDPIDSDSEAHLCRTTNCMDWLNTKEPASVVYFSFTNLAILSKEKTQKIALGLKVSGYSFIWVIRPPSSKRDINNIENLPAGFLNETYLLSRASHSTVSTAASSFSCVCGCVYDPLWSEFCYQLLKHIMVDMDKS